MNGERDDRSAAEVPGHLDAAPDGAVLAATRDTLLTRREVARELGKHVSTIRRLEQRSVLTPVLGPDGVHRFQRSQVQELVEVRERGPAGPDDYDDGDTTANVFKLFSERVEPVDVVIRLRLPAAVVETLHRKWVAMRGGYVVPFDIAREISALRWARIADAETLLRCLTLYRRLRQRGG